MKYDGYLRDDVDTVLFLSDIHLGVRNASVEWTENIVNYFNNFFLPYVRKIKAERKTPILIIAGDFFDNRQHVDINVLNVGFNIIESLANELEVFMTIGNHDIYKKKDIDVCSLRSFTHINNVHVLYKITKLTIKNGYSFGLFPWCVGDGKEETKTLSEYTKYMETKIAVVHSDISGMVYDNGRPITEGVDISKLTGLKIYSGHIHKRQSSDKVTYLGSPYQLTRSDIGNIKGIYSLNVENNSLIERFYENDYSPLFVKIRLDDILNENLGKIKSLIENNYTDIIIKNKDINDINVSKLIETLENLRPRKIEISLDKSDEMKEGIASTDAEGFTTMDEIFESKLNSMELDKSDYKKLSDMNSVYINLATEELNG